MEQTKKEPAQVIYDFVSGWGEYFGEKINIMDNSGTNRTPGNNTYWVWMVNGVSFEVGKHEEGYDFWVNWKGMVGAETEEDVIKLLEMLGFREELKLVS